MILKFFNRAAAIKPGLKLIILAGVLLVFGIVTTSRVIETNAGIDFYQFWGVGQAENISNGKLKSPYAEIYKYDNLFDAYVASSKDQRLQAANQVNHELNQIAVDPTGTPLFYSLFSFLPKDYSVAFNL